MTGLRLMEWEARVLVHHLLGVTVANPAPETKLLEVMVLDLMVPDNLPTEVTSEAEVTPANPRVPATPWSVTHISTRSSGLNSTIRVVSASSGN